MAGTPLKLDHQTLINGRALGAQYEDGAIEYVAQLDDPKIAEKIADGTIRHCSVEFEWQSLEKLGGHAPRDITFTGLSLLKDFQPGDPQTTVELWEAIISNLKEPKTQEQTSGQEFILHQIQGPQDFAEKSFLFTWVDQTNGVQGIYGLLDENSEELQPMALLFMKEGLDKRKSGGVAGQES